jgi:NADH dehydrogenase (ubiquinone) 1 alpha subcomplex subunit 12
MHRITDIVPEQRVKPVFEPEHQENVTGTKMAYRPYSTTRPKIHEWDPMTRRE